MASSPPRPHPSLHDLKRMRVQELRDALASRGLSTSGLKDSLIARLQACLQTSTTISPVIPTEDITDAPSISNVSEAQTGQAGGDIPTEPSNKEDEALSGDKQTEEGRLPEEKGETVRTEALLSQEMEEEDPLSPLNPSAEASQQSKKPAKLQPEQKFMQNSESLSVDAHALGKNPLPDASALARTSIQDGGLSDYERKRRRAERFGTDWQVSEREKRIMRAQRFSSDAVKTSREEGKKTEAEKRRDRAARFGIIDEESRKQARLQRFCVTPESGIMLEIHKKQQ